MGESDADWSGDVKDKKSTTGYYFKLNGCGAALRWDVKKQAAVAFSSSEAEYQGMAVAVQEVLYLKKLVQDFGIQQKHPIAIGEDNQICIKMNVPKHGHAQEEQTHRNEFSLHSRQDGEWYCFNSLRSY